MKQKLTEKKFLEDVKNHKMTIKQDNGVYRHLHFSDGTFNMHFEIITFPGGLLYRGDMGTYEFERVEDMFHFFKTGITDNGISINSIYWSEKCQSECKVSKIKEFCIDTFHESVKGYFKNNTYNKEKSYRQELWNDIKEQLLIDGNEWEMVSAIYDFRSDTGFEFIDFFESPVEAYTYRFLWCLCAIVWGIKQYFYYKGIK